MVSSSDDDGDGRESRSKMLKRHKAELLKAQKEGQRLGKKRGDEAAALVAQVTARHVAELAAFEAAAGAVETGPQEKQEATAEAVTGALEKATLAAAEPDVEESTGPSGKKASKAQKRRAQKSKEEADREARIAEENSRMGPSSRVVEEAALLEKLAPLGLIMREIKADGHCLYRSMEDQLALEQGGVAPAGKDYQSLRAAVAAHMRARPEEYMPFVNDCDDVASFEKYCSEIECTACWGGQLELRALCEVLRRRVTVYSAHLPTVEMGEESSTRVPLRVAFLQHAFGLGEHYNSVAAPNGAGGASRDD